MKKQALTIIFLLSSLFSFSQEALNYTDENGLKQGVWRINMKKVDEISYALVKYIDNLKEGEFKAFYHNGNLAVTGIYTKDLIDSLHLIYYKSGEIKVRTFYKNGLKEGKLIEYYKNGKTSTFEDYKRDTLVSHTSFYSNGNKQIEYKQKHGLLNGEYTHYHENGNIALRGNCVNGLEEGDWYLYTEDKKLRRIDKYVHGKIIKK